MQNNNVCVLKDFIRDIGNLMICMIYINSLNHQMRKMKTKNNKK